VIRELHPYELPEIIAVPLAGGLAAYLEWVEIETRP
jgi:periplasmic divalent cation tolerance protein